MVSNTRIKEASFSAGIVAALYSVSVFRTKEVEKSTLALGLLKFVCICSEWAYWYAEYYITISRYDLK